MDSKDRHKYSVLSPMAMGNGAYVVHKSLERAISGYQVIPYNPYRTLFPPSLFLLGRNHPADVIHTTPDYAFFHQRKKVPLVITFHNYVLDRFMRQYSSVLQNIHYQTDLKLFTRMALAKADAVTAVSRFTADLVRKELKPAQDIRVIYNGVDQTMFVPGKRNSNRGTKPLTVLFCGNLTRRKGAQWLGPIADRLGRNIVIAYTSGLRTTELLANHPRLSNIGKVPHQQMPAVYQDADILLFPTVREGFGLAAAEAMSCGLPVVATDCSSMPELIDHGKGGFLCPVGDVDAFAERISHLADSPQQRKEMGEYNRAKVERVFTLERMVREYEELFHEVLERKREG